MARRSELEKQNEELRQAQMQLRESEARFRTIAEHLEDVLYVQESDGSISYISPAYEHVWGRSAAQLLESGSDWMQGIVSEDRQRVGQAYEAMLRGDPFDEEYRITGPDCEGRWIRDRAFPVVDEDGAILCSVGIARNVTGEKELETNLRQVEKMEAAGTLASGIAHDFKNLLMGIIGCGELALVEGTPMDRIQRLVQESRDAARRGVDLASQLLTFARKRPLAPRPVSVNSVITDSRALLERILGEHIRLQIESNAQQDVVNVDPVQLQQILLNLATNARDAMSDGGTVTVRTDETRFDAAEAARYVLKGPGPFVRLSVRDSGAGMDEETRKRAFEPFFTTKAVGEGTGLGLSTVFAITRGLGGHVYLKSEVHHGTTLVLHLPCCEGDLPDPDAAPDRTRLSGTVLLVEDDRLVRLSVRHYLEELGLQVLEADGPESALALIESSRPRIDALVSDVIMPRMSGPRLAARLREEYPDLRVLYMSAYPDKELIKQGTVELGARVLEKPFDQDTLARTLREILGVPM